MTVGAMVFVALMAFRTLGGQYSAATARASRPPPSSGTSMVAVYLGHLVRDLRDQVATHVHHRLQVLFGLAAALWSSARSRTACRPGGGPARRPDASGTRAASATTRLRHPAVRRGRRPGGRRAHRRPRATPTRGPGGRRPAPSGARGRRPRRPALAGGRRVRRWCIGASAWSWSRSSSCSLVGLLAVVVVEWTVQVWADRATGDPEVNRAIRNRLMYPSRSRARRGDHRLRRLRPLPGAPRAAPSGLDGGRRRASPSADPPRRRPRGRPAPGQPHAGHRRSCSSAGIAVIAGGIAGVVIGEREFHEHEEARGGRRGRRRPAPAACPATTTIATTTTTSPDGGDGTTTTADGWRHDSTRPHRDARSDAAPLARLLLGALVLFLTGCAEDAPLDTLEPEGPAARTIDNLLNPVFDRRRPGLRVRRGRHRLPRLALPGGRGPRRTTTTTRSPCPPRSTATSCWSSAGRSSRR